MTEKMSTFIGKMGLYVVVLVVPLAVYPQNTVAHTRVTYEVD